ncbi:MAG: hypothetical protein IJW70_08090 [Clostridia bacterium]|nr:hypothetical protein [Clostridia bacterium]
MNKQKNTPTNPENTAHCRTYHKLTFGLYRLAGRIYAKTYAGFRSQKIRHDLQGPHLILANSQTLQDAWLVRLAFDYPVYCVQTRAVRRNPIGVLADLLTAPIEQKPCSVRWSSTCVQKITQVISEGGSVCLFPMGDAPYGNAPGTISKQTVPLIRALNVPVILYTIHGGTGALPRWGDGRRKGPFIGRSEKTLTPSEYEGMTDEALYELISRTLCINDKPLGLTYMGNHRAEKLERVLYVCPRCRQHSVLYTSGNHVSCRGCGMTANYTETGNFVFLNCETPIATPDAWMDYQLSWLKVHLDEMDGEIFTDEGVTILSVDKTPADEPLFGKLIMTRERLLLRFEDGEAGIRSVGFSLDSVSVLKPVGKTKLSLTTAQGTWEITGAPNFCAYKYAQLFRALRGQFKK